MKLEWKSSCEGVDWEELSKMYRLAPLGDKKPDDLEIAFKNSMYKFFVLFSGRLVGAGRALADGVDCSYICDVAVNSEFQGTGVGTEIISKLVESSKGHKKIILYSVPGKESFYKRHGFKRMSTAMAIFENQEYAVEVGLVNGT